MAPSRPHDGGHGAGDGPPPQRAAGGGRARAALRPTGADAPASGDAAGSLGGGGAAAAARSTLAPAPGRTRPSLEVPTLSSSGDGVDSVALSNFLAQTLTAQEKKKEEEKEKVEEGEAGGGKEGSSPWCSSSCMCKAGFPVSLSVCKDSDMRGAGFPGDDAARASSLSIGHDRGRPQVGWLGGWAVFSASLRALVGSGMRTAGSHCGDGLFAASVRTPAPCESVAPSLRGVGSTRLRLWSRLHFRSLEGWLHPEGHALTPCWVPCCEAGLPAGRRTNTVENLRPHPFNG